MATTTALAMMMMTTITTTMAATTMKTTKITTTTMETKTKTMTGRGRDWGTCNYDNDEAFGGNKRPSSREERVTVMTTMLLLPSTDVRRQLTRGNGATWGDGNVTISWGGQRVERAQRMRGMAPENVWWRSWWKWGGCYNQPGQMRTRGGGATRDGGAGGCTVGRAGWCAGERAGECEVVKGQEAKVEHAAGGAQSIMAPPWFLWQNVGMVVGVICFLS